MPKYFVYILQSSDGKFYVGYTTDLERRMEQHKTGKGSKFVRGFGFDKLLYHEKYATKSSALKREAEIKRLSRAEKEKLIMTHSTTVADLVRIYNLQPHPEGGFFKETFRDSSVIPQKALPKHFKGDRSFSTAIYFLLPEGTKSRLHRIASNEVWHFYLGDPLTVVQISPKGEVEKIILGQDVKTGQKVQHVVPAQYWFGAYPNPGSRFSFVGCTVAPGFDFADFEMGKRDQLLKQFSKAKDVIEFLTDSII